LNGEKIEDTRRGAARERARYYYLYHFTVSRVKGLIVISCKNLHFSLREEKEIFGANNRDTMSVHQNGRKTGVRRRSISGASRT
jgi:hypothetical protein